MHPPLAKHRHPECIEQIDALRICHKERSVAKFFGACNFDAKALDDCLYGEYRNTIEGKRQKKQEKVAQRQNKSKA